jgi:YD repeat-containing protein
VRITRTLACVAIWTAGATLTTHAQQEAPAAGSIRVTMSLNEDGSKTVYETDTANRKATATTTSEAGKLVGKIRYTLDEAGRYETGEVAGPDDKLRFKTLYKYDGAGQLKEETQLTPEGAVRHKIVYAFDAAGKPAGYSVFDASGKLLGQTRQRTPAAALAPQAPTKQRKR